MVLHLARAKERRLEEQRNIRRELGRGRLSMEKFRKGDRVRVHDAKSGRWSIKGTIASEICHEGAQNPSTYMIEADSRGNLLGNVKFIRLGAV